MSDGTWARPVSRWMPSVIRASQEDHAAERHRLDAVPAIEREMCQHILRVRKRVVLVLEIALEERLAQDAP